MDRLTTELQRLFALPGQGLARYDEALAAPQADGLRRVLCLGFLRASDWPAIQAFYEDLQSTLDLPLPALSVDGTGYRIWFSLVEGIDEQRASEFLHGLQNRYFSTLPKQYITLEQAPQLQFPPLALADGERWQAFIDPSMGSMFSSEPWLEFPPDPERQGELLGGFRSMPLRDFSAALHTLGDTANAAPASAPEAKPGRPAMHLTGPYADPHSFLLAVINSPEVDLGQRIEAAKSLLPHWPPQG